MGGAMANRDSSGVYTSKSVVNDLKHGNYICESDETYLDRHDGKQFRHKEKRPKKPPRNQVEIHKKETHSDTYIGSQFRYCVGSCVKVNTRDVDREEIRLLARKVQMFKEEGDCHSKGREN